MVTQFFQLSRIIAEKACPISDTSEQIQAAHSFSATILNYFLIDIGICPLSAALFFTPSVTPVLGVFFSERHHPTPKSVAP